jgi:acetylornithine deacetylase
MSGGGMRAGSALSELVARLVSIDSANPGLVEGGAGEGAVAAYVADWLEREGLEVSVAEVEPGRPNVTAVARGPGAGPSLLLLAHTDTVGPGAMERPHEPRVEDGRLHGRGAYDMKAGLAAAMSAAAALRDLPGKVVVAAVCDEEAGSLGTRALLAGGARFDAAIVTEPTDLDVAVAHKGFAGFQIATAGRAAHGSQPEQGVDAILAMGPIMAELRALDERLQGGPRHPLLGTESLHASLIEGGQEFSTYPERCLLSGEWRTLPGSTDVEAGLRDAVRRSGVEAEVRLVFTGEPFEAPTGHDIVRLLERHAGGSPVGLPYWADSALLTAAGIPTVLFGPSGAGAHASVEWVDLASVERVRDVLVTVAREFCETAR